MFLKTVLLGGEKLTPNQEKTRKIFMYLVSGAITTVVNWASYILFDKLVTNPLDLTLFGHSLSLKIVINQIICWLLAVLTAYFINRIFVFRSKGSAWRELITFMGARVLSFLVLELGLYLLMIKGCELISGQDKSSVICFIAGFGLTFEYMMKAFNSIFVVIANYILSKLMVFRKEDMVDYSEGKADE